MCIMKISPKSGRWSVIPFALSISDKVCHFRWLFYFYLKLVQSKILSESFGNNSDINSPHPIYLNGKVIDWVDGWVYLGVTLKCGLSFNCSVVERVRKFYRCANAIFRIEGRSDDLTMLWLVEAHCVPILSYGMEIVHISDSSERSKIRKAYNSLFRKIFGYRVLLGWSLLSLTGRIDLTIVKRARFGH